MSQESILVVDDNRQIANFLVHDLLPGLGYEAFHASSGKKALEILHLRTFSLMLLDLQLPDMTGLQLLRQLGSEGRHVPTILFTAHGSEQVAVEAFHLGVQDYLIKPVEPDDLNAAITRALTETRLRQEKTLLTAQLKEQVTWLTALTRVGQSVISTLEPNEVLRRIVEAGVHLTHADEGFLALLDDASGQLYLRAVKNIDEEKIKTLRLLVTDTLLGSVVQGGKPVRRSRSTAEPSLKVSTGFLVHSILHVPILSKGKSLGVLSVDNRSSKRPFTGIDESMLVSLANYASVAIENAELYQRAQQEIVERKRVETALRESEERYALAVQGANDGIWDWDLNKNRIYYSPRWKSMLGYKEKEVGDSPKEWFDRIHPEDLEQVRLDITNHIKGLSAHFESEHRVLHKDGAYRWMQCMGLAVHRESGSVARMAGSQADITDRKVAEQRLLHDAFHDTLTGLPNRSLFMDRLSYAVERAKRRGDYLFAVLYLDLDRFKDVNDSLGHMLGDQLLIASGRLLEGSLRPTDTVARLGGDEFVIMLEDINDVGDATRVAERIQQRLAAPLQLDGHNVSVTASIGIVLSLTGYQRAEDVLRDADIAMYRAKAHGKARYEIFDPAMRDRIMERLTLETQLRQALERQELRVFYQPIVSLETGKMIGLEALARWQHPQRGLVLPAEFIPLAEETGLIIPLDRWVMYEACRQLKDWQSRYTIDEPLTISVNISSKQLGENNLLSAIRNILQETELDPHQLKLEITESAIIENHERTAESFAELQKLGVQIQIDDFGVGYSSLSYLPRFHLDALKIAQSFVSTMEQDNNLLKIIQSIVMLTHGLGMGVIAEGVETEEQLERLRALGCEYGQGYLVSRPLDAPKIGDLLQNMEVGWTGFGPWRKD
jgi:diguanylate cyclase (GGDEF)-like protein/PAS domain S-box-containing protein